MSGRAGPRQPRSPWPSAALLGSLVLAGLLLAACGGSGPSLPGLPTASPAAGASGTAAAEPPGSNGPRPTAWSGNAVLGIEALGLADGQILAALADLGRGIATEDLAVIRTAAAGLAGLEVLLPNMEKVRTFDPMVPFADQYEAAITSIDAAAEEVVKAIDAEDPAAITASTQSLVEALRLYTAVQPQLATYVQESIEQRRLLLR